MGGVLSVVAHPTGVPWWPFRRCTPSPEPPRDRPFPTRDGLWVRSLGEQRVANFLSRRGVAYDYEPPEEGLRPDFRVRGTNVLIEYWGGAGFRDYAARMEAKTARFEAAGFDVVHLVPLHLRDLERVLGEELGKRGVLP